MVKYANVVAIGAVIVASGLASCDAARPRLASTTQNECTECKDPEDDTASYYVSIGVMPAPYPIDWTSPNTMYGTTLLTSAFGASNAILRDPLHSIGHAMLKVQCGENVQHYISQTGAVGDSLAQFKDLQIDRVNMLFKTWEDGFLDPNGKKDWEDQRA
ncbi:MAG TPA: hypothetical protein VLM79_30165, partial [Kofleriaceae bacterium]|nr:hypothetical protein [Kofleriaceae bacterium]